ncbi:MAG: universal stress protein UspA [Bacteroidetes bacterium CG12_big_fil_rev_8_21_14_0_65_60_17]|nr:MAG: universal stress protein UspA [Bacteroidetes bacterium CG12_big_fil_rev_8_21_14_0_65_60_17]
MIKRILVALDRDSDTPVATRYGIDMAKRFTARLTGLAVVDMESIESSARGGGIGSMYYAEKLRERLTEETRGRARKLLDEFKRIADTSACEHVELVEEGVPFERIVEDMKYHDVLVIGQDPHFFYAHPKKETQTLARVITQTIGPSLVVPGTYRPVKRVLFATDGGEPGARTLRRFVQMQPFGSDIDIDVLHVESTESAESALYLELTRSYLADYGFKANVLSMKDSDVEDCILREADNLESDLIVAGAKTKSGIRHVHLGKSTQVLLTRSKVPVFIDH